MNQIKTIFKLEDKDKIFEILSLLIKHDLIDPLANNNYAIRMAARYGHHQVVKLLLDWRSQPDPKGHIKRVDPSADNNYAICYTARNGHDKVVKLLLADKCVDPSADNNCAICYAAENGHIEVVKLLLADGRADPVAGDNYAIRMAARYGHDEVVKLLENYIQINNKHVQKIQLHMICPKELKGKISFNDIKIIYK